MNDVYDISVIGAGPGGYVAAIRAAQLGAKVCIIEKKDGIGGTCLNWGCIPTKSLLYSAHSWHKIKTQNITNQDISSIDLDMKKIVAKSRNSVEKLTQGVRALLINNGVEIYTGNAKILSPKKIAVLDKHIATNNILIATGGISKNHPLIPVDGKVVIHAKHAMMLDNIPNSIVIIGTGAIGIEFASLFHSLGSTVYLIELADRILPHADYDVSDYMNKKLSYDGVKIFTQASITDYHIDNGINLKLNSGRSIVADKCLIAIGITGNIFDLGLQNTKVEINDNMQIITDEFSQTAELGIYAVGDVNHKGPWLAHRASEEGIKCIEKIFNHSSKALRLDQITSCIYSMPQIASFGLTEKGAISQGYKTRIGIFPLKANGKAVATDDDGFIKLILDHDIGNILGAHIVSHNATELISTIGMMYSLEGIYNEIDYVFPHPTVSEIIPEAIMSAYNRSIHTFNKKTIDQSFI